MKKINIGDWLAIPRVFLQGQDWEFGEVVAEFGQFRVHRTAFVLRDGRRIAPGYEVIFGELPVPLHFSLWGDRKDNVLNRLCCIRVGSIPSDEPNVTVVDVYRRVQRWLRSRETTMDFYRKPHRGEDFRRAADRAELECQIVREGLQSLRAEYPELADLVEDKAARKKEERLQRRLRQWLPRGFWIAAKIQRPMQWITRRRLIRWIFRNQIKAMKQPTDPSDHSDTKEYRDWLVELDWTLHLNPGDADRLLDRGSAYLHLAENERAIADYTEVIRLKPDSADAYQYRSVAYASRGIVDSAIADLDMVIRLKPDDAGAYRVRGLANSNLQQYERAVPDFDTAIRLTPDDAEAYFWRGMAWHNVPTPAAIRAGDCRLHRGDSSQT